MPSAKTPALYTRKIKSVGIGVFTSSPIAKGKLVTPLSGFVLPTHALKPHLFALQIDKELWLCSKGGKHGGIDDFINHSCNANTAFTDGGLKLYALRAIAADEEITFDYSTAMTDKGWSLDCHCGTKQCRGTVTPFQKNSKKYQTAHRKRALDYIRKR